MRGPFVCYMKLYSFIVCFRPRHAKASYVIMVSEEIKITDGVFENRVLRRINEAKIEDLTADWRKVQS